MEMRRINRFFLLFGICLLFGIMSGCGPNDQKEEELGLAEVLSNAQNRINSLTGHHTLAKAQVNQRPSENQSSFKYELDVKFNNQQQARHSIKRQFANDSEGVLEVYVVDGYTYFKSEGKWKSVKNKKEQFVYSINPSDFLRFVSEANGQGVTLKEEPDAYVINVDKTGGKKFLQQFYAEQRVELEQQRVYITTEDFHTKSFAQKIWIDKQTFNFRKMETKLIAKLEYKGKSVVSETQLQVKYLGEYNNRIQPPENMKSKHNSK